MIVLKEELSCEEESLGYGFIKEYYPKSTLISKYEIGLYTYIYEYDEHSRLKSEMISKYSDYTFCYKTMYKKDYLYHPGGCRVFYNRIGSVIINEFSPDIVQEENELLSIEEFKISENGLITSLKITDLHSNSISVYDYIYDEKGRLIKKIIKAENLSIDFSYIDDTLAYTSYANLKIIHYYDDSKNEIKREYVNTNELEKEHCIINFSFQENILREVIIDIPRFGFLFDCEIEKSVLDFYKPKLRFNEFEESEVNYNDSFTEIEADYKSLIKILKLPSYHYLGWIEDFWRIGFKKIHSKYNYKQDIESISFIDESDVVIDKLYFLYFDNLNTSSQSKLKNMLCLKIKNSEIVKLFEHTVYY